MKTIILGREEPKVLDPQKGEVYQPFSYTAQQKGVSHKHATITIDDDGCWWIEDRWSTNGTFIREEDGSFRRIGNKESPGKCRITPMTFVRLGTEDATGCSFYARQADAFGDFDKDFEYIQSQIEALQNHEKKRRKKTKYISIFLELILPITIALVMFFVSKRLNAGNSVSLGAGIGGGMLISIISRMMRFIYNPQEKNKDIEKYTKERKKQFTTCPNPKCNHLLSDADIELMRCGSCKIKHS